MPKSRAASSRCARRRGRTRSGCTSPGSFRVDVDNGTLSLEAIDALDGTPVIDVKPYFASVDSVPDATVRPAEES